MTTAPVSPASAASPAAARAAGAVRAVLRAPFTADTWRRGAYLTAALPVGLLGLVAPRTAARTQARLVQGLLGVRVEPGGRGRGAVLAHALLTAPLNLAALVVACYSWSLVVLNLGYPLRPGLDAADAWGGPTLAGAWALHAGAGGLGFLLLTPWIVRGFTAVQARLAAGLLGGDRTRLGRTVALALAVAGLCALLCGPVVHQL